MANAMDIKTAIDTLCNEIAREAFRRYARDLTPLYLYGDKEDGIFRRLQVAHDRPKYNELVALTMIPRHLEVAQLARWVKPWLNSAPIIQEDDTLAILEDSDNA